jgi:hypothetical protein
MSDAAAELHMDPVGGRIERPRERLHKPTFWPVLSTLSLRGAADSTHVCFEAATAVSFSPEHVLEWIVARNSTKERAFGLLPVLAHPIGGTSDDPQVHHAAMIVTPAAEHTLPEDLRRQLELVFLPDELHAPKRFARSLFSCDDPSVSFAAAKRADVGNGLILRLVCEDPRSQTVAVRVGATPILSAAIADAREADLGPLELQDGAARVTIRNRLTTIRVVH